MATLLGRYNDRAYSGGNMEPPCLLQRLLKDIDASLIDTLRRANGGKEERNGQRPHEAVLYGRIDFSSS